MSILAREFLQDEASVTALRTAARFMLYGLAVGFGLNLYEVPPFPHVPRVPQVPITHQAGISPRSTYVNVPANDYLAIAAKTGVDATPVCGRCGETNAKND